MNYLISAMQWVALTLFVSISIPTRADTTELPIRHVLTLSAAKQLIAAVETKARREGWPCVVAVVDTAGYPIAMERMDASMLASVELAPAKARTAAMFGKPSQALENAIRNGRLAATTAGFVEMTGALPLTVGGEEIGAIGVSSPKPEWDAQLAEVGAQTWTALSSDAKQ